MNLRSLPTRIAIVFAAVMAFAFNGDDATFTFSLSADRIFYPGAPETGIEFSGYGVGRAKVYMRAFRIPDPVDFFLAQKDPHAPSLQSLNPPNTFDMLRQGYDKVSRDARYAARDVMPAGARRAIRDVADLNGTKSAKAAEKERPVTKPDSNQLAVDDLPKGAERYQIVASWEHNLELKKDEDPEDRWHYETIPVPIKEKGVYLIEARVRGKRALTTLVVSEYGMIVKQSKTEVLSFVVNMRTGLKVADMPLVVARNGSKLAEKETGSDGTVRVSVPAPAKPESSSSDEDEWRWSYRERTLLVVGERDGNFVISDPYFYQYGSAGASRFYVHTDRPIYRPGHTVYYRGIARGINIDGTYRQPSAGEKMVVKLEDARGDVVRRDTVSTSDLGTFNGQYVIPDEPPLGGWSLEVYRAGEDEDEGEWFSFSVEEYKKPEYKVVVTTDRTNYTRGDAISATVKADYFFGSPVANASVEYFVYRARYWRPWWRGSDWEYLYDDGEDDYYTYRMEMVGSGKGELAPDGTMKINWKSDSAADRDYVYRIQANVVDNSRRSISGAKSVEVTRGEFWIATNTDRYVYKPNDDVRVESRMGTFDGDHPVATSYTVNVVLNWWDKVKNDTVDGGFEYKHRTKLIWSGPGATTADGKGTVVYKATAPGYYEVQVAARDKRGTEITESSYIYIADPAYANWYHEGSSDVQIIPDKPAYKPGETMSALVIMPTPNIDALVSVEGATIYSQQVERLNGTSAIVRIQIEERFAPTFYLSAAAVANEELYSESQRVAVVPDGKVLHLDVTTDKSQYRPGEKGTVTVHAVDDHGNAVAHADIAVGVVDEAIYSIEPENAPDIQRYFYGSRWNEVETSSSLNFSFYGEAVRMDRDATDALYGARGNRDSLNARSARFASREGSRAIAFGDVKGSMFVQPMTRKNFKDMMFWTASVRTDANGRATMPVEFPDNLTTWRITARGVTASTAVGQATARVVARKELLVRMETPRFLVQGDELLIATTVHNYLSSAKVAKVELSGENISMADHEQTVTIAANGEQRIDWKVSARFTGTASLTVKALTNEESDAMELTVPVMPRGMRLATGAATQLDGGSGTRALSLTMPQGADATTGMINVTLAPSLAGALLGSLDGLIGYPYGCVEQTMSRFLPTVVVADALHKLDLPFDEKRRAELPKMVGRGLSKLYGMQHEDGGWGWWANDQTDAFMTAYVVYGLTIASRAGYEIDQERYDKGVERLERIITLGKAAGVPRNLDGTTNAYLLYVMSVVNNGKPLRLLNERLILATAKDTVNDYGRALLALACRNQGLRSQSAALVAKLEAAATTSGDYVFWQPKGARWYWQTDPVEATAFAVRAILETRGETPIATKGIQWLLMQKTGDEWGNTRQTSMVIYSLVDYIKRTGQLTPDYTVTVKVNGREAYTKHVTSADVFAKELSVALPASGLVIGANNVSIEKNGNGRLYASARLSYYATGPALRSTSAGFTVKREYYALRKERRGDIIVYVKEPFTGTLKTGDEIFVKVKMTPDRRYEYIMLEDPIPAGCEPVLSTEGYTIAGEPEYDEAARKARGEMWDWLWWYADRNFRDEKVSFFAREVQPQAYQFTYVMRAQIPGTYAVMPSVASLMYYTDVRGNGEPTSLKILP